MTWPLKLLILIEESFKVSNNVNIYQAIFGKISQKHAI